MPLVVADRVKDTTTTTGTGAITLSGTAPTGYRTFASVLATNDLCYYCIASDGGSEWEVGIGKLTASTTLARQTVLASSNAGALVSFSAGTKDVFLTAPAAELRAAATIDDRAFFDGRYGAPLAYDQEFDASGSSLPSGWSWVNQGDSTYTEGDGGAQVLCAYTGGTTSGSANERHRMLVRSLPSESTWSAFARVAQAFARVGSWHRMGLVLRASGSGEYIAFTRSMEGAEQFAKISINYWSAINTYGGSQPIDRVYTDFVRYLRIRKNSATSFDFLASTSGRSWYPILSAHNPSYFGSGIDQIGFLFACNDSDGLYADLDWFRVR